MSIGRYWPPSDRVGTTATACLAARHCARTQATLLVEAIAENVPELEQQLKRVQRLSRHGDGTYCSRMPSDDLAKCPASQSSAARTYNTSGLILDNVTRLRIGCERLTIGR